MVEIVSAKSSFTVKTIEGLENLRIFMEVNKLGKPNFSKIGRDLTKDPRTIKKYYDGFEKATTRCKKSVVDEFYDVIKKLLCASPENIVKFYYIDHLHRYLQREHDLVTCRSNFHYYITQHKEFYSYFKENKSMAALMTEKPFGKQAQLDWKEKIKFTYSTGEIDVIHVASLILSASGTKTHEVYPSMSQDCLFDFLVTAFEEIGGVPDEILIDNAKTMMEKHRTKKFKGKVNAKMQQFADDFGFKVKPCIAGRPRTKAKVENPMKIIDEIRNYNGTLANFNELREKVKVICKEANSRINQKTNLPPVLVFQKEKEHLNPLPSVNVCSSYKLTVKKLNVNINSLFNYKSNKYSVPTEYIDKTVTVKVLDDTLYVYYSKKLITTHKLSSKKINYITEHHLQLTKITFPHYCETKTIEYAKNHLEQLEEFNEQLSNVTR